MADHHGPHDLDLRRESEEPAEVASPVTLIRHMSGHRVY
jgi:hypothetical protein